MRLAIWHGYLLGGTGSNVYTRALAREWSRAGHDVTVVCQERRPEQFDLGGARIVRPELPDGLLPVFVMDGYEGLRPRLLQDMSRAERERYVAANVEALRATLPADLVLANHVLPGAAVAAGSGARFSVKVHGSELEYSMRHSPELRVWGRDSLARASSIFVGSEHIRKALEEVVGPVERVHAVPPGVDVDRFVPKPRDEALSALVEEARRDPPNPGNANERMPDDGNAERIARFLEGDEPTVAYVGKLILNKGVALFLEALGRLEVRALVVGFGEHRAQLEAAAPSRSLFTGALEHRHLAHLLPLATTTVVPSIFPEAFGMIAAEAAAAGSPPLVAHHSGLAEVATGLAEGYPHHLRHLASFENKNVDDLTAKLRELVNLGTADHAALQRAGRDTVVARWSWRSVAARLLAPLGKSAEDAGRSVVL